MKKIIAFLSALLVSAAIFAADPAVGLWKSIDDKTGEKNKKYTATQPTLAMAGTVGPIQVFQYWIPATEDDIKAAQEKYPAKNK